MFVLHSLANKMLYSDEPSFFFHSCIPFLNINSFVSPYIIWYIEERGDNFPPISAVILVSFPEFINQILGMQYHSGGIHVQVELVEKILLRDIRVKTREIASAKVA